MKNLKNLGVVLTKTEQKAINGGISICCIRIPTNGKTQLPKDKPKACNTPACQAHACCKD